MPYDLHILLNEITIKCFSVIYFMPGAVLNIANINSSSSYDNLKRQVLSHLFYGRVYSGTEWLSNLTTIVQLIKGRAGTRTGHLAPECMLLSAMLGELSKQGNFLPFLRQANFFRIQFKSYILSYGQDEKKLSFINRKFSQSLGISRVLSCFSNGKSKVSSIGVGGIITDHGERWADVVETQHIYSIGNEVFPERSMLQ